MIQTNEIAKAYPGEMPNGKITFAGCLRKYFYDIANPKLAISQYWRKEETKEQYVRDYEERILPHIPKLPLEYFSEELLIQILQKIDDENQYSASTLLHYKNLLWVVYRAGYEHHEYNDQIHWEKSGIARLNMTGEQSESTTKRLFLTKKSFSKKEELKILQWFCELEPEKASGFEIGMILQLFTGMRNQEATGCNYGAIRQITKEKIPVIMIYQTTKIHSTARKISGKTQNAPRIIPIFPFLFDFFEKRKVYLREKTKQSKEIIEQLPVVCSDADYSKACAADDLTRYSHQLFNQLKIGDKLIDNLRLATFIQRIQKEEIVENDPTAYLLRRNFATSLATIGLTSSEIQYLIGHSIEDFEEERNMLSNDDRLCEMYHKLLRHSFIEKIDKIRNIPTLKSRQITLSKKMTAVEDINEFEVSIQAPKSETEYLIEVEDYEPEDSWEIEVKNNSGFKIDGIISKNSRDYRSNSILFD